MWTILFLILIFYVLYVLLKPFIKIWSTIHKAQKGDFSGFGDFFSQPGSQKSKSAYDAEGRRKGGWSNGRIRKKKIGKDVGEYVKFSEVSVSEQERTATAGREEHWATEQQVSDIEWEEIPTR